MPRATLRSVMIQALALAILAGLASAAGAADFRGSDWGDSQAEVKQREPHPMHHDIPGELAYWRFSLAGVPSGLTYTFVDDRLVEARYYSRHVTPDIDLDWADFTAYRHHFAERFGDPGTPSWTWAGATDHEREETVAEIAAGRVIHAIRWTVDTAEVELRIEGSDGGIDLLRATFRPRDSARSVH